MAKAQDVSAVDLKSKPSSAQQDLEWEQLYVTSLLICLSQQ